MSLTVVIDGKPLRFLLHRYDRTTRTLSLLRRKEKILVVFSEDYNPETDGLPTELIPVWREAHQRKVISLTLQTTRPDQVRTERVPRQIEHWKARFDGDSIRYCHLRARPLPLITEDLRALKAARETVTAHDQAARAPVASGRQEAEYWAVQREKYKKLRSDWRAVAALGVTEMEFQTFLMWMDCNGNMAETARRLNAANKTRYTRQTVDYRLRNFARKSGIHLDTGKPDARKAPLFD